MGRQVYRGIEIRGVVYPDANAAAAALGGSQRIAASHRNGRCRS